MTGPDKPHINSDTVLDILKTACNLLANVTNGGGIPALNGVAAVAGEVITIAQV